MSMVPIEEIISKSISMQAGGLGTESKRYRYDNITETLQINMWSDSIVPVIIRAEPGMLNKVKSGISDSNLDFTQKAITRVASPTIPLPSQPLINSFPSCMQGLPPPPLLPFGMLTPMFSRSITIEKFDLFSLLCTPNQILDISSIDGVKMIFENKVNKVSGDYKIIYSAETAKAQGVDEAWKLGYKGKGKKIAVIDTGILPPPFGQGLPDKIEWTSVIPFQPWDEVGHGHWCVNRVGGKPIQYADGSKSFGFAPEANVRSIKALGFILGIGSDDLIAAGMADAMDWGADVISMSLGSAASNEANSVLCQIINETKDKFIWNIAAGNDGLNGANTIGTPGNAKYAITHGSCVYSIFMDSGKVVRSYFSSIGRTLDGYNKPTFVGFGGGGKSKDDLMEYIHCGTSFGSSLDGTVDCLKNGHEPMQGTSMITPGNGALILDAMQKDSGLGTDELLKIAEKRSYDTEIGHGLLRWQDLIS